MKQIELSKIPITGLELNESIELEESACKKIGILNGQNIWLKGKITKNQSQEYQLNLHITGELILPDARTLEPLAYPIDIKLDEKIEEENETIGEYFEKSKNTLDIMGVLWENIVLEVPISISKGNLDKTYGDGWELVSKTKEEIDPRLAPLRKLLDSEKE